MVSLGMTKGINYNIFEKNRSIYLKVGFSAPLQLHLLYFRAKGEPQLKPDLPAAKPDAAYFSRVETAEK